MNRRKEYEKERNKKRLEQRKKERENNDPPGITENGRRIRKFMIQNAVRGNYKDFVLIFDSTLIDYLGALPVPVEFEGIALVHKRNLKNILKPDVAAKFWHPKLGRVGGFLKPGTKKSLHNSRK